MSYKQQALKAKIAQYKRVLARNPTDLWVAEALDSMIKELGYDPTGETNEELVKRVIAAHKTTLMALKDR